MKLTEFDRLRMLPTFPPVDATSIAERVSGRLRRHDAAPLLLPEQAQALVQISAAPPRIGHISFIDVGGGKTLLIQLIPRVVPNKRPLLLLPASLLRELDNELAKWEPHYRLARPPTLTYGMLSRPDSTAKLREIAPDLIICDEAHMLANRDSARGKRLLRYIAQAPNTRLVLLSASFTKSSLDQIGHLLHAALRHRSPLPIKRGDLESWCSVVDVGGEATRMDKDYVAAVVGRPAADTKADWRRQLREHFRRSPHMVLSSEASVNAKLYMRWWMGPDTSPSIQKALKALRGTWELPDGTPLVEAMHLKSVASMLALGFWHQEIEDRSDYKAARGAWHKELRRIKTYQSREGFDSAKLIEDQAMLRRLDARAMAAWDAWVPYKDEPKPRTRPVWFDTSKVEAAVQWAQENQALVWWHNKTLGDKLAEQGLSRHGRGDPDPSPGRAAALSIPVFGKGRNLQAWDTSLILQPPAGVDLWQQLLGRTHRRGQKRDAVTWHVAGWTVEQQERVLTGKIQARYVEEGFGLRQKLLQAIWQ